MTLPPGTLTDQEAAEIQAIADHFNTVIDVVGSRARGEGRWIDTARPMGSDDESRSDIDFRIDSLHTEVDSLIRELKKVGNGAGKASKKYSRNSRDTYRPFIRIEPTV